MLCWGETANVYYYPQFSSFLSLYSQREGRSLLTKIMVGQSTLVTFVEAIEVDDGDGESFGLFENLAPGRRCR